jgi:hypothetical protein
MHTDGQTDRWMDGVILIGALWITNMPKKYLKENTLLISIMLLLAGVSRKVN